MKKFNDKPASKTKEDKDKKRNTFDSVNALYEGRKFNLNAFRSAKFPIKDKQGKQVEGFKVLTPKQMPQKLPISVAKVKAGNTSKNILNEIRQTIYSLYRAKEITKKVFNKVKRQNGYYIYEF